MAGTIAAVFLYKLSLLLLKNEKAAFLSTLIFIFNPSSVFYIAPYSESFFALFSFLGLYLYYNDYI